MRVLWTCGLMMLLLVAGLFGHAVEAVARQGGCEGPCPTATVGAPTVVPTPRNGGNQNRRGGRHGQEGGRHGRDEARPDLTITAQVIARERRVIIDPFDTIR